MSPKNTVAAGFVIFRYISQRVEFLLLQTSYGIHHWTPPKGHMDPGETKLTTAFRETKEESGLGEGDLKVFEDCIKILNYNVNGKSKTVYYWLAELINPNITIHLSHEHQDFKWLELEDACKYADYQDMQKLFHEFDRFIKHLS